MHSSADTTVKSYYFISTLIAILICSALVSFLQWPLLAEIPLAACIFIQVIALSISLKKYWIRFDGKELITYLFAKSKAQLLHFETSEEEANI